MTLRVARASKVIGMPVTQAQCEGVFQRLGLRFTSSPGQITVTPPSWRFDLRIEEDLIEEVIRVVGYRQLPDTPPLAPVTPRVRTETQRGVNDLRHAMAALGFQETITFSFVEERWETELAGNADPIRVLNPIASPLAVMRSSLLGSLVGALQFNLARKATRARLFEVARVYRRSPSAVNHATGVAGVEQPRKLAGLAWGSVDALQWGQKERAVDFFDLKGDVEALLAPRAAVFRPAEHPALHPGRSARIEVDGHAIGFIGELHPRWRQAYELPSAPMLFELELSALLGPRPPDASRPCPGSSPLGATSPSWPVTQVTHDALIEAVKARRPRPGALGAPLRHLPSECAGRRYAPR